MLTLAALTSAHRVGVAEFPAVPLDAPGALRRVVVLSAFDGTAPASSALLKTWLAGQQPPFAPGSVTADGPDLVLSLPRAVTDRAVTALTSPDNDPVVAVTQVTASAEAWAGGTVMILHRRVLILIAAFGAALGLALAVAAPAMAADQAYLRLAHLSPDTPKVDVYVASVADPGNSFVVPGVGYGAVSPYRPVAPGSYVVSMRAAGAPKDSPPVISTTVDAKAGQAYTVAGTGLSASLGLTVLNDQLDLPPAGKAAVRCINGAVSASSVDLGQAGKQPWATGVKFATTTQYTDVNAGTWTLRVTAPGKPPVDLPVTVGPELHLLGRAAGQEGRVQRADHPRQRRLAGGPGRRRRDRVRRHHRPTRSPYSPSAPRPWRSAPWPRRHGRGSGVLVRASRVHRRAGRPPVDSGVPPASWALRR